MSVIWLLSSNNVTYIFSRNGIIAMDVYSPTEWNLTEWKPDRHGKHADRHFSKMWFNCCLDSIIIAPNAYVANVVKLVYLHFFSLLISFVSLISNIHNVFLHGNLDTLFKITSHLILDFQFQSRTAHAVYMRDKRRRPLWTKFDKRADGRPTLLIFPLLFSLSAKWTWQDSRN